MQYLKDDVKHNIMQAALSEFSQHGYLNASMRQIANTAGITPGNIYRYFKNKEELFHELLHPVHEKFLKYLMDIQKEIEENLSLNCLDPMHSIRMVESTILELMQHSNTEFRLMLNQSEGSKYEQVKRDLIDIVVHILRTVLLIKHEVETLPLETSQMAQMTATTLIEGLCLILRDYEDGPTVTRLIDELLHLYTAGFHLKLDK